MFTDFRSGSDTARASSFAAAVFDHFMHIAKNQVAHSIYAFAQSDAAGEIVKNDDGGQSCKWIAHAILHADVPW